MLLHRNTAAIALLFFLHCFEGVLAAFQKASLNQNVCVTRKNKYGVLMIPRHGMPLAFSTQKLGWKTLQKGLFCSQGNGQLIGPSKGNRPEFCSGCQSLQRKTFHATYPWHRSNSILLAMSADKGFPPLFDEQDYDFFRRIGVSPSASTVEIEKAYVEALSDTENRKERMDLKDKWFDINQKIFSSDLNLFEACQHSKKPWFNPFRGGGNDIEIKKHPISEFSEEYLKQLDWPQETKDKLIHRRSRRSSGLVYSLSGSVEGGIFQRSTVQRVRSITQFMLPLLVLGGVIPKLSPPSIAVCTMLTAALISGRGAPPPKTDDTGKRLDVAPPSLQTLVLTTLILALHGALGAALATLFLRLVELPLFLTTEGVVAMFINSQLLFAALYYKTFVPSKEIHED
ncbi:hypothetical protein IE077_000801 [Cardiosporidium cionae]|uniref:Uncharacterized protein n=1 Tax=Cardiosporidium cionae TaxID=476202 RepID=A0ABQ7J6H1_9APIC|nr:hypothetical protein IE077_000801 [Cardiosporidium cionae]|eukprot:KAF8819582.1 hypothetical protein IE077_000801 [Cardiosporidium cionae]